MQGTHICGPRAVLAATDDEPTRLLSAAALGGPARQLAAAAFVPGVALNEVHIVVGTVAIALNGLTCLYGAWRWWRVEPSSAWFWRLLRAGQVTVVLEAALGGVLELVDRKAPGLHVLYGVLPLLVSLIAEQLRIASAQMVLDSRGYESAQAVGKLPEAEQRFVVIAILRREVGVMSLAALVVVVLLARAAGTA